MDSCWRQPRPLDLPTIPAGPVLVEPSAGRVGSGLGLEVLGRLDVPVSLPVTGSVTTAVANIPNRTSTAGFASSLRTLVAPDPDFVMLNEVSRRSLDEMRAIAPAYDAYRDEAPDRSLGGGQPSVQQRRHVARRALAARRRGPGQDRRRRPDLLQRPGR